MINLHDSMGPHRDRTRDPGSAVRHASVARHVTDCATRPGSPPVLAYADYTLPFVLNIDTSGDGLGAVHYQEHYGEELVIAYASRGLRASKCNYPN